MHAALNKDDVLALVRQVERGEAGHTLANRRDLEAVVGGFVARIEAGLALIKEAGVDASAVHATLVAAHSVRSTGRCTELVFVPGGTVKTERGEKTEPHRVECFRSMTTDPPRGIDPDVPHADVVLDVRGLDVSNRQRKALGFSKEQFVRAL